MQNIRTSKFIVGAFAWFLFLALVNSVLFGFSHTPTWQDAAQYSAYASNLVSGNGYSLDGGSFSNYREPGYPLFLASVYWFFGNENITAVTIAQAILLSLVALMYLLLFNKIQFFRGGLLIGTLIAAFPFYGYYTHEIGSETLFLFLITVVMFILFAVVKRKENSWSTNLWLYILLGVVVGYGVLVRVQFLFFLLFTTVLTVVFFQKYISWKGLFISMGVSGIVIFGWVWVVHSHTGTFSITNGRPELVLFVRAQRAELSYADLGRYYIAWIHRKVTADYMDPMLRRADIVGLYPVYTELTVSADQISQIKNENIHTLVSRPLHYLAGNIVEIAKLYYIDYLYTPYLGRIVRAGMYLTLYLWTIFGLWSLYVHRKMITESMWMFLSIAGILVLYNTVFLSFFDTIPRYNTPFLVFFLALGTLGLFPLWRNRTALRE